MGRASIGERLFRVKLPLPVAVEKNAIAAAGALLELGGASRRSHA